MRVLNQSLKSLELMLVSAFLVFLSTSTYAISDEPAIHCDPTKGCQPKANGKYKISDEPAFQCGSKKGCKQKKDAIKKRLMKNPPPGRLKR